MSISVVPGLVAVAAINNVRNIQHTIKKEQDELLEKNRLIFESGEFADVTLDNVAKQARINIANDLYAIGTFNGLVKVFGGAPYGIRNNKMFEILTELCGLSDETLIRLASGTSVNAFDNVIVVGELPALGDAGFWGSSSSTFYSAALGITNLTMKNSLVFSQLTTKSSSASDIIDFGKSAIAHSFTMPTTFNAEFVPQSNYINTEEPGKMTFSFYHSGYSFGGSYSSTNAFAPQDCGTFVGRQYLREKLCSRANVSTADLYCAFRYHNKLPQIRQGWDSSESYNIVQLFDVERKNILGSVYIKRRFTKDALEATTLGASGHAAIIIGRNNTGEFFTIGASREMPKIEGYGTQSFAQELPKGEADKAYEQVYVLSPSQELLRQPEFDDFRELPYAGVQDLRELVEYFDVKMNV